MVVVLGSVNLDQIGQVERLPMPGETVLGTKFSMAPGGKGANQALAARRAGAGVKLFSAIGTDVFAAMTLELLQQDGVDLSGVIKVDDNTGTAVILVDLKGENVIAVMPGANNRIGEAQAHAAVSAVCPGEVLVLQQEVPPMTNRVALERAATLGVRTIFNLAPFISETPALAKLASIVVANETEFLLLTEKNGLELEAALAEFAAVNRQTVIVTVGARGAYLADERGVVSVPAWPVNVVDTVGAGDTFCGYLAASIEAGMPLIEATARAAKAASLACCSSGAQPSIPRLAV